jgi:hypothetical protein
MLSGVSREIFLLFRKIFVVSAKQIEDHANKNNPNQTPRIFFNIHKKNKN